MTYGEIYAKFKKKYPKLSQKINDYRPANLSNSITVWLNVNNEEEEVELGGHVLKVKKNVFKMAVQYIDEIDSFILIDDGNGYMD